MKKERKRISIALTADELSDLKLIKHHTGHGATDIMRHIIKTLKKQMPTPKQEEE